MSHHPRDDGAYRKLIDHPDWEIPVPGREAVVGFVVVFAVSLLLHVFVIWLSQLFRGP